MTGPKPENASAKLEALETWSARATLLILAGIILEITILFIFSHDVSGEEKALLVLADALIGIGLAIEYFCILKTIKASGELQRSSDEKVAMAEQRAAEANQKAEVATHAIATANSQAALASLEQERLKAQLAWRRLSPQQYEILVHGLKAGTPGTVELENISDPEATLFAADISQALQAGGWQVSRRSRFTTGMPPFGLIIEQTSNTNPHPLAIALANAGLHIDCHGGAAEGHFVLIVGVKPPPF